MNGTLAQLVALANYGNAGLTDRGSVDIDEFAAENSVFKYVKSVTFDGVEGVRPWFEAMSSEGVRQIQLALDGHELGREDEVLAPHVAAAFSGGSHEYLVASGDGKETAWFATWDWSESSQKDGRWEVSYSSVPAVNAPRIISVELAAKRLAQVLRRARKFASANGLDPWPAVFEEALRQGNTPGLQPKYHPDLFPAGVFPAAAERLAAMAQMADVFGGMGSWNDVWLQNAFTKTRYKRLSARLFSCVRTGFAASVSSLNR